jgi:hypothetical protein
LLFFRPAGARPTDGQTVIVMVQAGKLQMAATRVVLGPEEHRVVIFFPVLLQAWPDARESWRWEELEAKIDALVSAFPALVGNPAVVGQMLSVGWHPE